MSLDLSCTPRPQSSDLVIAKRAGRVASKSKAGQLQAKKVLSVAWSRAGLLVAFTAAGPGTALADETLIFKHINNFITVQPDGNTTSEISVELGIGNDAMARTAGQQTIAYSPSLEQLEVLTAQTHKSDGRVLPVPPASIQERLLPAAANAAGFDDRHAKIAIFPDVGAGDTLVLKVRRTTLRPYFPGYFATMAVLPGVFPTNNYEVVISTPSSMPIRTENRVIELDKEVQGDRTLYRFHASLMATDTTTHALGPADYAPIFGISSFKDWDEFADVYSALVLPKTEVTDAISKLAREVTAGIDDRKEQTRLLYEWVSTHIRYVNVVLGIGGFEPHAAAEVLANRHGDCKDHTVLYHALLSAVGIPSEMAIIQLGNLYSLPTTANYGFFNHIISYIPEFDMYADTTASTSQFGTLPFQEYGKSVIRVAPSTPRTKSAVYKIPVLAPDLASVELNTQAELNEDGVMRGTSTTIATGPFATMLRGLSRNLQIEGPVAGERQLKGQGVNGTGQFTFLESAPLARDYRLTGSFTLDGRREIVDGASFTLPTGLRLIARPGDYLAGQIFARPLKPSETIPCWSGRQVENLALSVPEGRKLDRLPKPIDINKDGVSYKSVWSQDERVIRVHREFTSDFKEALCGPDQRRAMASTLNTIRADIDRNVSLADADIP
jgi:transglutaminase-like putative cysteine protease